MGSLFKVIGESGPLAGRAASCVDVPVQRGREDVDGAGRPLSPWRRGQPPLALATGGVSPSLTSVGGEALRAHQVALASCLLT